ncbi:MAG TPA: ROK family protein [Acidimicrobiales bacterium]|jgi:polyphosphate glucokinase|nr:ROK family protein [Acidimicrobiales bacterium]
MAPLRIPVQDQVLAVDIGATNVKFCHVDIHGELLEGVRRRPTPYPCSPERLIEALDERIETSACPRVGIGFPGEFIDGHVVRPGNLSRPGGVTTEVDPVLEAQWKGFELQAALREATGRDVRVVNDATLAALGSIDGHGVELVLTLGTGLGIALAIDGTLRKIRDVGAEVFVRGKTYDQTIGEHSRSMDEEHWGELLVMAVDGFVQEFGASTVHLAGGNARRVPPTLFADSAYRVVINGNQASIRGAAKLFYN